MTWREKKKKKYNPPTNYRVSKCGLSASEHSHRESDAFIQLRISLATFNIHTHTHAHIHTHTHTQSWTCICLWMRSAHMSSIDTSSSPLRVMQEPTPGGARLISSNEGEMSIAPSAVVSGITSMLHLSSRYHRASPLYLCSIHSLTAYICTYNVPRIRAGP